MAHETGLWLPRLFLSQIEDIPAAVTPNSKGTMIHGSNRRRGETEKTEKERAVFREHRAGTAFSVPRKGESL
ncbi:MAG: hypothetical protein PHX61_13190, partial [Alphaproteobacteria bacterium]|nr:hypothetical protein [Alphaproteobacteria bacterium]